MRLRLLFPTLLALSLSGCGSDDPAAEPEKLPFPAGFLFGSAIAGFQADMGCPTLPASECEDPSSDWYQFVTSPETVGDAAAHLSGQPPSAGPGHWELYEQDYDLAANEVGQNAMRFSVEWSRVFPTATDNIEGHDALKAVASAGALDHYRAELAALKARGMTPLVTLNHYTLPSWIHDAVGCHSAIENCSPRGWLDKDRTVREIAKYAGFVARELGADVDRWATLNEPFAVVLPGYLQPSAERTNPPAVSLRFAEAKAVMLGLIEAHARMYDAVKAGDVEDADGDGQSAEVGLVYSMAPVKPADPENALDVQAAKNVFYLYNMAYLNAVAKGDLDEDLDGVAERRDDLAGRMDYLGINYYTRVTVQGTADPFLPELSSLSTFNPLTVEPWEDYPRGLYEMVMVARDELGLPAIITENGAEDPADDGTAPSFLVRHLTWASRAIRDGADVRGYFYWTLMDNYEWNHGMDIRMGLYAVDKDDPQKLRAPRQAVAAYSSIIRAGEIPAELAQQHPAP
jgi:beta-glucosidase/6-phospho-beta-glucosidase/beta-galactosidase